ncbi:UPF0154 protein [Philodulcilactobacillus myokoensis]|uniref:UPF0154 protein WR164_09400 n=1 Tax=Philodulcilactobacillus myokoensis TaxID=2929573 RepID=A0A9W6B198_9LACO|nr:YneF family protein [Philodulcilactobacillus myokoensis]GLB46961.1 UPF0154 protein [Philodulcilactobacillus myokoensis]
MATWIWIVIVILALLVGVLGGFYMARKYMEKYLHNNPPISEEQMSTMMAQMGQRPSQKKLRQMMNTMKNRSGK